MKQILTDLVNRLSDLAASVDAMEIELAENGVLTRDAIRNRFQAHKVTTEKHLVSVRSLIFQLPE
jgi:hypothetical protein